MTATTFFITGASRGLGLEFATQLLAYSPQHRVVVTARNPSKAPLLQELVKANEGRIHVLEMDVADEASVKSAVAELESSSFVPNGIDVLINNAGVANGGFGSVTTTSTADFLSNLTTNVLGVASTTIALLPLLRKGEKKQIFALSSEMGSIGTETYGAAAGTYCVSKAALNQWMVKLSRELREEKFTVIPMCPGYVTTDMTNHQGKWTPQESISRCLQNVILKATFADSGKYISGTTGEIYPW